MRLVFLAFSACVLAYGQYPCSVRVDLLQYPLLAAWTEVQGDVLAEFTITDRGRITGDLQLTGPSRLYEAARVVVLNSEFASSCAGSRKVLFEFRVRDVIAHDFNPSAQPLRPDQYRVSVNKRYLIADNVARLSRPSWPKRAWRAVFRR